MKKCLGFVGSDGDSYCVTWEDETQRDVFEMVNDAQEITTSDELGAFDVERVAQQLDQITGQATPLNMTSMAVKTIDGAKKHKRKLVASAVAAAAGASALYYFS